MLPRIFDLSNVPPSYLQNTAETIPSITMEGLPVALQYIAGIMTLLTFGTALLAWYRTNKPRTKTVNRLPEYEDVSTAIYFTGPLKAIFDTIQDIKGRQILNRMEAKDDIAAMLSDQRRQLADHIERIGPNVGSQLTAAEHRVNANINSVHSRIDDMNNVIVELNTRVEQLQKRR
jgi:hypothetical protein